MLTKPHDAFSGQSRPPNIIPFHMLGIVSSCAKVTLSLRRDTIFKVFRYSTSKNVVTLTRGHSRSLKVVPIYRLGVGFLLVFYRNSVRKTHDI